MTTQKRISKPEGDGRTSGIPFCSYDLKINMEECEMKKKVMFVMAALAAVGAAVTGCVCLGNVKLYGR